MPWSPVPKFPEIITHIKTKMNIMYEINIDKLKIAIITILGVTKPTTISNIIGIMCDLGYLKLKQTHVWEISRSKPYDFASNVENEIKEIDKILESKKVIK